MNENPRGAQDAESTSAYLGSGNPVTVPEGTSAKPLPGAAIAG
jgi:hypothetical protein